MHNCFEKNFIFFTTHIHHFIIIKKKEDIKQELLYEWNR